MSFDTMLDSDSAGPAGRITDPVRGIGSLPGLAGALGGIVLTWMMSRG